MPYGWVVENPPIPPGNQHGCLLHKTGSCSIVAAGGGCRDEGPVEERSVARQSSREAMPGGSMQESSLGPPDTPLGHKRGR